jgi:hypothetical protein
LDYRDSHGYALLRGYPEMDDDLPGGSALRVMDLVFSGASRLSFWKEIGPIFVREASGGDLAEITARIGVLRSGQKLFLVREGSLEDYVVSYGLQWAEFDLPSGAQSPLVSEDLAYQQRYQPLNGEVYFV